jgi:hypothetical protein
MGCIAWYRFWVKMRRMKVCIACCRVFDTASGSGRSMIPNVAFKRIRSLRVLAVTECIVEGSGGRDSGLLGGCWNNVGV